MSAYAELSAALRQPMRDWWRRTGAWLLLVMALSWSLSSACIALRIYDPRDPPAGLTFGAALYLVSGLLGLPLAPIIWLLATRAMLTSVTRLGTPTWQSATNGIPAIFLHCLSQGTWPLIFWWILALGTRLVDKVVFHPDQISLASFLLGVPGTFSIMMMFLPAFLVGAALVAVSKRFGLGLCLVFSVVANEMAWRIVALEESNKPWHPWHPAFWWLWEVMLLISAGTLSVMIYGLMTRKPIVWRSAYLAIVCGLLIETPLHNFYLSHKTWFLWGISETIRGFWYLTIRHKEVGSWLAEKFAAALPQQSTLLGCAAPAIPLLWSLIHLAGLFALLYWLLGEPWERRKERRLAPIQKPRRPAISA